MLQTADGAICCFSSEKVRAYIRPDQRYICVCIACVQARHLPAVAMARGSLTQKIGSLLLAAAAATLCLSDNANCRPQKQQQQSARFHCHFKRCSNCSAMTCVLRASARACVNMLTVKTSYVFFRVFVYRTPQLNIMSLCLVLFFPSIPASIFKLWDFVELWDN